MCANEAKNATAALGASRKKPAKRSVLTEKKEGDEKEAPADEGTLLTGYSGSATTH